MIKRTLIFSSLLLVAAGAQAQNEQDALRLSQTNPTATALSLGMGGVGGSMGGDFNSLSINPAGIGVYRSGELSITPSLKISDVRTDLGNFSTQKSSTKMNLDNFGLVLQHTPRSGRWRSVSFGVGVNTVQNFNATERTEIENFQSSISDVMSASAYSFGVDENVVPPFGHLGYWGYLIDEDYNPVVPVTQGLYQDKLVRHRGTAQEINLTLGGNYGERIHLGLGLGFVTTNYSRNTNFFEADLTNDQYNYFDYADLTEQVETKGLGFNLKLGAIFMPSDNVRLGASVHTPTWHSFTDLSDYVLYTNTETWKADAGYSDIHPESEVMPPYAYSFNYGLRSPWKGVLSGTLLGRMGMVSADIEFADYGSMKYTMVDHPQYERDINKSISDMYGMSTTMRVGGELVLDNLFLRAGGAYQTSPYRASDAGGERLDLSVGAGLRWRTFFLDLGYMNRRSQVNSSLYGVTGASFYNPQIEGVYSQHFVSLTLGMKMRR